MAKAEKKERKLITSLPNLNEVDKNFNIEDKSSNKKSSYQIQIRTTQELIDKLKFLHISFLGRTENYSEYRYLMTFFSKMVQDFLDDLKEKSFYYVSNKEFIKYITRKGQRRKGERTTDKNEDARMLILGKYTDNTKDNLNDLMYSLAKKDNMVHMGEYSANYFLIDIIKYIEDNLDRFVDKYRIHLDF